MNAQQTPSHWQHKSRVAKDFGAAATRYDRSARLQRTVVEALMALQPTGEARAVLDLGCGTGLAIPKLAHHFPQARLHALDLAEGMVAYTQERFGNQLSTAAVADAEALPLPQGCVDRVFSSLMIQWCPAPSRVLQEIHRVLQPGGVALISTLVDGTLLELKEAWEVIDPEGHHVNRFVRRDSLEDLCRAVFPEFEVSYQTVTLVYDNVTHLFRELKGIGARYKADDRSGRVTAPGRIRALQQAYEEAHGDGGCIPARYEVALAVLHKPH
ncbi:malonyl-ACP O-methyltransferase BioC [Marinobacteraceae bacterium S3BR75-40.1]